MAELKKAMAMKVFALSFQRASHTDCDNTRTFGTDASIIHRESRSSTFHVSAASMCKCRPAKA